MASKSKKKVSQKKVNNQEEHKSNEEIKTEELGKEVISKVKNTISEIKEDSKDIKNNIIEEANNIEEKINTFDKMEIDEEKIKSNIKKRINNKEFNLSLEQISKWLKTLSWFAMIFSIIVAIFFTVVFAYSVVCSIVNGAESVYNNTYIIETINGFISIGNYDHSIISLLADILLPLLIIVIVFLSSAVLFNYIYKIFKGVKKDSDLFCKEKLEMLNRAKKITFMITLIAIIDFYIFCFFGFLILIACELFEYMFRKIVEKENEH